MDVISNIFSCIINVHYLEILDAHGTNFQFGGTPNIGFIDGLFTIKTLLNMRKNHNLPIFEDFFNIVKAFDTDGREILIKLLRRYRDPPIFPQISIECIRI